MSERALLIVSGCSWAGVALALVAVIIVALKDRSKSPTADRATKAILACLVLFVAIALTADSIRLRIGKRARIANWVTHVEGEKQGSTR